MIKFDFRIIISTFRIFFIAVIFFVLLLIFGHFIAYFSVGKIKLFKYIILSASFFISVLSFLLIYADVVPIIVFVTILTLIRWGKYVLQNYPFIESVKAIVDFGISLFLTVCSTILWFIFELFKNKSFSLEKFVEFFFSTVFLPLMIIYTICFNEKKEKRDQADNINIDINKNENINNYYIDFSTKIYNKYVMKKKEKSN